MEFNVVYMIQTNWNLFLIRLVLSTYADWIWWKFIYSILSYYASFPLIEKNNYLTVREVKITKETL